MKCLKEEEDAAAMRKIRWNDCDMLISFETEIITRGMFWKKDDQSHRNLKFFLKTEKKFSMASIIHVLT